MKATETKSTHSQQPATATTDTLVQEQAFFSTSTVESTPFFPAASAPGIQATLSGRSTPFFQPNRSPSLQFKCATCSAEAEREQPKIQRQTAFESEAEPDLQQQTAFESEESAPLQSKSAIAPPSTSDTPASSASDLETILEESPEDTSPLSLQTQMTGESAPVDETDGLPASTATPFFQPKLTMGQVGDRYEREADAMADRVVSQPSKRPIAAHLASPELQQTIQRLESLLQRAESRTRTPSPPANFESRLQQSQGSGSPMDSHTRADMEGAFDADFSGVKVHTGQDSAAMNQSIGARAFTHGNNIFFNAGEYQPQTQSGRHLLAHELTHTLQQGASLQQKPAISSTSNDVQMLPDFILAEANEYARNIPGYTLFTVIVGYNPLTGTAVERNAINLLEGVMGLVPFGTFIFDKLQEYGILQAAFDWVNGELDRLDLSLSRLEQIIEEAGAEIGYDIFSADDVLEKHFTRLYNDVEAFARSLVDHIIELIKEAVINVAEPLLADNQAWNLLKKILHYDPLRGEEVNATTAEILEDFLLLIGKQQELEKMKEEGTLQRTADWLDTQMATFDALLGELQSLVTSAIDAIRPENLTELPTNLETLATRVDGFLQRVWDFASTVAIQVLEFIKDVVVGVLRTYATNETPGYPLLTVILGKDPFTQERVPRTPINLIRGFMSLMPGGIEQFNQMQETGVIPRAAERIETMMADLGITWPFIRDLFLAIWDSLTIEDLLHPIDTFIRILTQFREPLNRLFTFVIEVIKVILELILELMNFPSDLLASIINNAMQALDDIQRDPVGFLLNMLEAVKLGFSNFFDNILQHLGEGLQNWFFAQLEKGGITPPTDLNPESILDLVLQILGVSMDQIWSKLAERIGQENVDRIRGAIDRLVGIWNFISDVQERGVGAIWDYIQSQLSNLWTMVLEQAQEWIMTRVIERVTARLLSMLDPTGIMAVINGFISFFNAVQSAIEYFREILEIVNDWVTTVASVARGDIEPGAQKMEEGLASSIPVAIGFLAKQVGLDNLGEKIAEILATIHEVVDQALNWLMDRAVSMGQSLLRSLGLGRPETVEQPTGPDGQVSDTVVGDTVSFRGGNEQHRVYVVVNGTQVEVMVASDTPLPLSTKLSNWESSLGNLAPEQQQIARTLIATVRSQYNIVVREGQEANQAINQAQQTSTAENATRAQQQDNEVEKAERSITPELGQLFDIFEGGVPFQAIEESIPLQGGTDQLSIRPDNRGNLGVFIQDREITSLFVSMISGPLGNAIHNRGTVLVESIADNVDPMLYQIRAIPLNDGKIASSAIELLRSRARTISQQLSRVGPEMKASSLGRLLRLEPTDKMVVTFAQEIGETPTIVNEYDRQLHEQQIGLNELTIDRWVVNRNAYSLDENKLSQMDADERVTVLRELHERATIAEENARGRKQRYQDAIDEIQKALNTDSLPDFTKLSLVTGRFGNETAWRRRHRDGIAALLTELRKGITDWEEILEVAAVLHNADQIAGGFGTIPDISVVPRPASNADKTAWENYINQLRRYVGSFRINSGIGSLWSHNIDKLEADIRAAYKAEGWPIWRMNVELHRI
jgi:hypothetical protein